MRPKRPRPIATLAAPGIAVDQIEHVVAAYLFGLSRLRQDYRPTLIAISLQAGGLSVASHAGDNAYGVFAWFLMASHFAQFVYHSRQLENRLANFDGRPTVAPGLLGFPKNFASYFLACFALVLLFAAPFALAWGTIVLGVHLTFLNNARDSVIGLVLGLGPYLAMLVFFAAVAPAAWLFSRCFYAPLITLDWNLTSSEALKVSFKRARGQFTVVSAFTMTFLILQLLGLMTGGLLQPVAWTVASHAWARLYRTLAVPSPVGSHGALTLGDIEVRVAAPKVKWGKPSPFANFLMLCVVPPMLMLNLGWLPMEFMWPVLAFALFTTIYTYRSRPRIVIEPAPAALHKPKSTALEREETGPL